MLNRIPVHQDKLWLVSLGSIKWTAQTVERNLYKALSFNRVGRHKIEYCRASWERRQELTLIFHTSLLKMLWSRFIFMLMLALVSARPSPELSLEEIEKGKLSCKTEQYKSVIFSCVHRFCYQDGGLKFCSTMSSPWLCQRLFSLDFLYIGGIEYVLQWNNFILKRFIPIIQVSTRLLHLL